MVKDGEIPSIPKTSQAISLILSSMGVEDAESKVLHQLMDFTYRTTADFLETAAVYAEHAGRSDLTVDDVKLAIQSRVSSEFTGPPPREVMAELAAERNEEALPIIPEKFGLRLPPERFCLTQPNYAVVGLMDSANGEDTSALNVLTAKITENSSVKQNRSLRSAGLVPMDDDY